MNRIRAGFVHRFPAENVRMDLIGGERGHRHQCGFGTRIFKPTYLFLVPAFQRWSNETNPGDDVMTSSGKLVKHVHRISIVAWLAENLAIDYDNCVCAQNELAGQLLKRCPSFFARQPLRTIERRFSWLGYFRNVCRMYGERNTRVAEQFLAARRGGSEYERRGFTHA